MKISRSLKGDGAIGGNLGASIGNVGIGGLNMPKETSSLTRTNNKAKTQAVKIKHSKNSETPNNLNLAADEDNFLPEIAEKQSKLVKISLTS